MTKHFHILLWIPLIYATLFFILWVRIYANEVISFETWVLEKEANYAAESAIEELLVASDLNQDYASGSSVTLEPDLAIDDFAHTLCLNYGYIPTEETINRVKNENIRTLVIASYDGIYAFYKMQTETNAWELKQTPKIPYFYTASDGTQYCLTLDETKGYWDYYDDEGNYKLHKLDTYDKAPSSDLQATAISEQVADIINWALYESYSQGKSDLRIEIPAVGESIRGGQSIQTPTIIAVIDGNRTSFATTITAESIGGAQLEETDHVIGYTLNNTHGLSGKFYAYSSWWETHSSYLSDQSVRDTGVYFDSVFDAAKAGYNDLNLIE